MEHRHRLHFLSGHGPLRWLLRLAAPDVRARHSRLRAAQRAWQLVLSMAILLIATAAHARVFMTQQQALASAFPSGATVSRQAIFLKPDQLDAARKQSGVEFKDQMIVRYTAASAGKIVGYAYFDTHLVRTLQETVMVVVTADGTIARVDILSFNEPQDYMPRARWIDQFDGRKLDDDLSLKRSIRPISGASLSGRAIVNASRKILALHRVLEAK